MVADEFLAELERVHNHFEWKLLPDGTRILDRRQGTRLRLRGICREDIYFLMFDPIGAVCHIRTDLAYINDSWMQAADILGLSLIDAGDLTAAANDVTWRTENGVRERDLHIQSLRRRLLRAVSLDV